MRKGGVAMIYCYKERNMPSDFCPKFQVVANILETKKGEVLFLLRADGVLQEFTWGSPAGKVKKKELIVKAVMRETKEETGINLEYCGQERIAIVYVRYPDYDFIFHLFRHRVEKMLDVVYDTRKHHDFCWMRPKDAIANLPLIAGMDECLHMVYN